MSLEKKLFQLGKSKNFQPDNDWEKATKHELLLEIHAQNRLHKAQQLTTAERFDLIMMRFTRRLMPSMTKAIVAVLIVTMGSGTAFAAQSSIPGEVLWPIKRSIEKAELTITFNPIKETEVHIKHINKRLVEIDKILKTSQDNKTVKSEKIAKKEKSIKQVVSHLEKDIAAVDTSLKIVKEEKEPLEIVELAKKVTKVTKDADIALKENVKVSKDKIINDALNDVKKSNKKVKDSAVNLALEVHEKIAVEATQEVTAEVSAEEQADIVEEAAAVAVVVTEMIANEISQLSDDIDQTQVKVDVIGQDKLNAELKTESIEKGVEPILEKIGEVKEQPQEAGVVLDEAKILLGNGSLKDALDKVTESKEINDKTGVVLEMLDTAAKATIKANAEDNVDDVENNVDIENINDDANPVEQIININAETGEQELITDVETAVIESDEDEAIIEESDLEEAN